jgi:hypothetical protein
MKDWGKNKKAAEIKGEKVEKIKKEWGKFV